MLSFVHASVQQLPSSHVQYDSLNIGSPKLLKDAVKTSSYPPTINSVVEYRAELRRTGRRTGVGLHISGMDPEMEFQCPAYEKIQGGCTPPTMEPTETETTSQSIISVCPCGMQDLGGSCNVHAECICASLHFPFLNIIKTSCVEVFFIYYMLYTCVGELTYVICTPSMINMHSLNYRYAA